MRLGLLVMFLSLSKFPLLGTKADSTCPQTPRPPKPHRGYAARIDGIQDKSQLRVQKAFISRRWPRSGAQGARFRRQGGLNTHGRSQTNRSRWGGGGVPGKRPQGTVRTPSGNVHVGRTLSATRNRASEARARVVTGCQLCRTFRRPRGRGVRGLDAVWHRAGSAVLGAGLRPDPQHPHAQGAGEGGSRKPGPVGGWVVLAVIQPGLCHTRVGGAAGQNPKAPGRFSQIQL